jgi:hypothetical protein
MRKTAIALLALGLAAILATPALAVSFWSETFTYANGNLAVSPAVSGGNWTNHSTGTTAPADIQVVSGTARGDMSQQPDDNRTFTARTTGDSTYACMVVKIPTPTITPVINNYFAHFKDTGTINFLGRLFVLPVVGDASKFTFGISVSSVNTTVRPVAWGTALNFDQAYNVVIQYNAAAGRARLWVDPVNEGSTFVQSNTSSSTITPIAISAFALRQSSSGSPDAGSPSWTYVVDNLGVGPSFTDACNAGPTPARTPTWGHLKALYR